MVTTLAAGFATYRIVRLLTLDRITRAPRYRIVRLLRRSRVGRAVMVPVSCVPCFGVWVALPVTYVAGRRGTELAVEWFATAGVALFAAFVAGDAGVDFPD